MDPQEMVKHMTRLHPISTLLQVANLILALAIIAFLYPPILIVYAAAAVMLLVSFLVVAVIVWVYKDKEKTRKMIHSE